MHTASDADERLIKAVGLDFGIRLKEINQTADEKSESTKGSAYYTSRREYHRLPFHSLAYLKSLSYFHCLLCIGVPVLDVAE